jgi:hypothetical protein
LQENLLKARSVADKVGIAECLGLFASLATQSGDFLRGLMLSAAADAERERSHLSKSWHNARWQGRDIEASHAFFEEAQFNTVWEEGSRISLAKAIEVGAQIDPGLDG